MSRSFHTTRKDVEKQYRYNYASDSMRAENINKLKAELDSKRETKRQTKSLRNTNTSLPITPIDAIAIEIKDKSKYLHYPAGPEDIAGLLKRMPQGMADGLARITLCLGSPYEHKMEGFWSDKLEPEFDPLVGREGNCVFDGVYRGSTLGIYYPGKLEIRVFGYVYDPDLDDRKMWELYFRLRMLMVLAHEIGHHYDFCCRIARGRWRFDDDDKIEIYAEQMQHKWAREYLIPYLKETYSREVDQLNDWMGTEIGCVCPLEMLAGDPRARAKNGMIRTSSLFGTAIAFECFVDGILKGKDIAEVRLEFANDMLWAHEYNMALQLIDGVLEQRPTYSKALVLKADVYVHKGEYHEAIRLTERILEREQESIRALELMADGYAGLKAWKKVVALYGQVMELCESQNRNNYALALREWARANMECGNYVAVEEAIDKFMKGNRLWKKMGQRLSAEYEKRLNS